MTEQPGATTNVCSYPDCGHHGHYQRVTVDAKNGTIIRKTTEIFCQHHWWTIEEKK